MSHKRIAILGSTGSIGTQTLEVIDENPDKFSVNVLAAYSNAELLAKQALKYKPSIVVIVDENKRPILKDYLKNTNITILSGTEALCEAVTISGIDMVLTAMVGFAGLAPTIKAIKSGKDIALANKETLVVAGELIMQLAKDYRVNIYPVDSEHSAIFQCLVGENKKSVEKIYLTASGGPFRNTDIETLKKATKNEALKHPNWSMGNKITIDSASLMNKGLEVIEARWLFDLKPEQIDVVIHPQSIIHSVAQFCDGSIKAQMGLPDMKLPILYALSYPNRLNSSFPRFNFLDFPQLTFESVDYQKFPNLKLAYDAMKKCGNAPCILNAANEIVVEAFLKDQISFPGMSTIIEKTLSVCQFIAKPDYDTLIECDKEARETARKMIKI
jgi:1-deoxy-D-xylulose-5-phosphate reductoisomerase